jgi:cytochrome c55X
MQGTEDKNLQTRWFLNAVLPAMLTLSVTLGSSSVLLAQTESGLSVERQQELIYLLRQDCGSCHGMTLKGGLGPSLLPDALAGKPAEYLRLIIKKGRPEKAMPPWENILTDTEIDFLVQQLLMTATQQTAGQP